MNKDSSGATVAIAAVGAGRWGANLIRVLGQNPRVSFRRVCDAEPRLAAAAARQVRARPTSDFDDVLRDKEIEAVVVATPSALHFAHAVAALNAGKHVYVEKPMAMSTVEARQMIAAAEANGRRLMVGHNFLYNGAVREVKRRIDAGELGHIYYVYGSRLNQFLRDSNVVWTLGPHDISIINYWLGEVPCHVSARGAMHAYPQLGWPEVCFAQLDYPSGRTAHLHLSCVDPRKLREMVVVGSERMIVYDDMKSDQMIQIFDRSAESFESAAAKSLSGFRPRLREGDILIPHLRMREPLSVEIEEFVSAILEGRTPMTDGRHGLEIVAVMEAMSKSIARNGQVEAVDQAATASSEPAAGAARAAGTR